MTKMKANRKGRAGNSMRIVFMGTPDIAALSLDRLHSDGHDIAGVFTQPDKPGGRGMKLRKSPVKELADSLGLPVFQPATLKSEETQETLARLHCDLIALVAYGKLLPLQVLELPTFGCVNIHASILPKYRGAAPIQWSILNGEPTTGVTSMYMSEELDAGDIISSKQTPIGDGETSGMLYARLGAMGADLLSETIAAISLGAAARTPQRHEDATFAPMLNKSMSPVDWNDPALRIRHKVLGLDPWPAATADLLGKNCKLFSPQIGSHGQGEPPGQILLATKDGIEIACGDGSVLIGEVQPPGGRRMKAEEFLRGFRPGDGLWTGFKA